MFSVHFGLTEPPRCYADTLDTDAAAYARHSRYSVLVLNQYLAYNSAGSVRGVLAPEIRQGSALARWAQII